MPQDGGVTKAGLRPIVENALPPHKIIIILTERLPNA
jgi:hypothetical protein